MITIKAISLPRVQKKPEATNDTRLFHLQEFIINTKFFYIYTFDFNLEITKMVRLFASIFSATKKLQ